MYSGDLEPGHVGPPLPCNMIKLEDVPHMEYFSSHGRGEICIKGANVFQVVIFSDSSLHVYK